MGAPLAQRIVAGVLLDHRLQDEDVGHLVDVLRLLCKPIGLKLQLSR